MKKLYIAITAVVAIALIAGGILFFTAAKKQYSVEDVLTEGPLVYLHFTKINQRVERFTTTKFWQDLKTFDYTTAAEQLGVPLDTLTNAEKSLDAAFSPENVAALKALFGEEVAIAVYPDENFQVSANPADMIKSLTDMAGNISIVTRVGPQVQAAESMSKFMGQFSKDFQSQVISYKGKKINLIRSKDGKVTIGYVRFNDLIVFGIGEKAGRSAIDAATKSKKSLNDDLIYSQRKKNTLNDADSIGFVRLEAIYKLIKEQIDQLAADKKAKSSAMAMEKLQEQFKQTQGIESVVFSGVSGDMLRGKASLYFDPARLHPDMRPLYTCAPAENRSEKFVPWDSMLYQWTNCVDFTALYLQYKQEVDAQGQIIGKPAMFDDMIAGYENMLGLSISQDVLPTLGKEVGMYLTDVNTVGNFPIPKLVLFVEITDRAKMTRIIDKLLALQPGLQFEEEKYGEETIRSIAIPIADQFKLGYTFIDKYFLVTSNVAVLKDSLDTFKDPSKSVAINSSYQLIEKELGKNLNSIVFSRPDRIFQEVSDVMDWSVRTAKEGMDQRKAFLAGSQKNLGDLKVKEGALGADLKQLEADLAIARGAADPGAEDLNKKVEALKQDIAANKDQQTQLTETIKSYEAKSVMPAASEELVDKIIKPFLKVLGNIKVLTSATINREGSMESVSFFKME